MIIYLHGFNSSAMSEKARLTVEYCAAQQVVCAAPTLHHHPQKAQAQIEALLPTDGSPCALIGSSMGGFYATHFCERSPRYRAVLINPAVRLAEKFKTIVGQTQKNYHNDAEYIFSQSHWDAVAAMETEKIADPSRYFLLAQTGDEVLDYREAKSFYAGAKQLIEEGGDHSFVDYARHLPAVIAFAQFADSAQ